MLKSLEGKKKYIVLGVLEDMLDICSVKVGVLKVRVKVFLLVIMV